MQVQSPPQSMIDAIQGIKINNQYNWVMSSELCNMLMPMINHACSRVLQYMSTHHKVSIELDQSCYQLYPEIAQLDTTIKELTERVHDSHDQVDQQAVQQLNRKYKTVKVVDIRYVQMVLTKMFLNSKNPEDFYSAMHGFNERFNCPEMFSYFQNIIEGDVSAQKDVPYVHLMPSHLTPIIPDTLVLTLPAKVYLLFWAQQTTQYQICSAASFALVKEDGNRRFKNKRKYQQHVDDQAPTSSSSKAQDELTIHNFPLMRSIIGYEQCPMHQVWKGLKLPVHLTMKHADFDSYWDISR